jgi:glycosidase
MRWLEDKEQGRASAFLGRAVHRPAAAVLFALDGVPHILMGQEFDEPTWTGWQVLFSGWKLDWNAGDPDLYDHYRKLIGLRRGHAALRQGVTTFLDDLPPRCVGFMRSDGHEDIVVLANLSATPRAFAAGLADVAPLYASGWQAPDTTLAPYGWLIGTIKKGRHEGALK